MPTHLKEKRDIVISTRVNVRFDIPLKELTEELIVLHKATDVSDYLRGLVIYDAFANGKLRPGIPIPGWITNRILKK